MDAKPVLLEMRDITKSFGEARVLRGVNFSLNAGEVHVLLGENGAGKSTLMKILSGIYAPDEGEIHINGVKRQKFSVHESRREGIAIVYQELSLVPGLSVASNIFLGHEPKYRGLVNNKLLVKMSNDLFAEYGFSLNVEAETGALNFAQQQLVEIVKALSQNAKIIVMDEPTSALTAEEEDALFNIIRKLCERGKGIIYISHRMEEVLKIADEITVLRDGVNQGTLKRKEADLYKLIELITGKVTDNSKTSGERPFVSKSSNHILLEVDHLKTTFGLRDVSVSLHDGEILGVAGLVGSGRSTLARALFGLERITAGIMRLNGNSYQPKTPLDAIKAKVALIPEKRREQALFGDLSVEYNLTALSDVEISRATFLKWLAFIDKNLCRLMAEKQVRDLKIACNGIYQRAGELSGGTQQKVVLGRWLSKQLRLLILDEPTSGVDIGTKHGIWALIDEIAKEGMGVLFISSDFSELVRVCHRVVVMKDGVLSNMEGNIDELSIRLTIH